MTSLDNIRRTITETIHQVLSQSGRPTPVLADNDLLTAKVGLDSLDLALTVVMLEQAFGVDPFRTAGARARTVGELTKLYEQALAAK